MKAANHHLSIRQSLRPVQCTLNHYLKYILKVPSCVSFGFLYLTSFFNQFFPLPGSLHGQYFNI